MSGAERIQVNPEPRPDAGWFLRVDGPDGDGFISVGKCPAAMGCSVGEEIRMHTRDWCALFDWWACNIWGMEGNDDGESTTEADQPSPPETQG